MPRLRRPLRVERPAVHHFTTDDGVELRLTRYRGGPRGPVLVVHCIGVSSGMYASDTIPTTLVEYLYERDYDIWLLDFRFSIELRASLRQSTFDDVALRDYPAAVASVRELAGVDSVQVVAHGVGSSTFTMAMLAGLDGVHSAVCSQVSTHLFIPFLNRLKTRLRMPSMLYGLGRRTLTAYVDRYSSWWSRPYDLGLRLYPVQGEERCDSRVCRRITVMYGALYEHDRLSQATHAHLDEMFGVVNLRAFRQLALISRVGHLVSARGADVYLPHVERLAIPITFLHGAENECVLPRSTAVTQELLSARNGANLYRRHLIPDYGHVDCMIGENASNDVYPLIVEHLDATAR